ncbi:MAG: S8 family serine peptidase, partial [Armatimonadetes bacterium]|nr:S8 family serine peptidase [Armatimonadota bacterium]
IRWYFPGALTATLLVGGLMAVFVVLGSTPSTQAQGGGPVYVPGHYIVVLKDEVQNPGAVAAQMARAHGLAVGHVYAAALKGFSAAIPDARLGAVANDARVRYVEQDQVMFALGKLAGKPGGGGSTQPAQTVPTGIYRIDADLSSAAAGNGSGSVDVDIAIIDTGIQKDHPDLNVVGGVNFSTGKSYSDGHGHGTHVAGTAAARDNAIGVVGVAPGARLWAVRVLDNSGFGWTSDVIAGVNWVAAHAGTVEVANMSLGGGPSNALDDAVRNAIAAGVIFTLAAGNETDSAANHSPARVQEALTVSAIADSDGQCGGTGADTSYGADDTFATFSNFGSRVDVAAPGVSIFSTYKGSGYATFSGTSMAAPHVAGAAALYVATHGRNADGNGVIDGADVAAINAALVSMGTPQSQTCQVDATGRERGGFTGDPDSSAEPLLDAGGL